jgi:TNF receptor-associated factor 4
MAIESFNKDELSFIEEPPEIIEIECPICLQVMLDDPHLATCCGHHFCGPCIKRVKYGHGACPYCKEKNYQTVPDKNRLRIINGLKVHCTNVLKGCQWKNELKLLPVHLSKNKRKGECLHELIKCCNKNCDVKLQRKDLEIHEKGSCPRRPYKCEYCQHKGIYESIVEQHYDECTKYPISCPNECHKILPRCIIEVHLSTECPMQETTCDFEWAGCQFKGLRRDVSQHCMRRQLDHMLLLGKACNDLRKENKELKEDCEALKIDAKEMKTKYQIENEELKQQVQVLNTDNKELQGAVVNLKQRLVHIHHAIIGKKYPILPITVTLFGEIHFYTDLCGYHMSVERKNCFAFHTVKSDDEDEKYEELVSFKVYKGKFDHCHIAGVSEIVFKAKEEIRKITKRNCESHRTSFEKESNLIQEYTVKIDLAINTIEVISIS